MTVANERRRPAEPRDPALWDAINTAAHDVMQKVSRLHSEMQTNQPESSSVRNLFGTGMQSDETARFRYSEIEGVAELASAIRSRPVLYQKFAAPFSSQGNEASVPVGAQRIRAQRAPNPV
jgi:hypothetical protein